MIPGLHYCGACNKPYPTQREADLCTPEYLIPERYPLAERTDTL